MTNLEKFREVFGDVMGDVQCTKDWAEAEYKGPARPTTQDRFIHWLEDHKNKLKWKSETLGGELAVYISHYDGTPIIRVSSFDNAVTTEHGRATYIRYDGLTGYKSFDEVKEIIEREIKKKDKTYFDDLFDNVFNPYGGKSKR